MFGPENGVCNYLAQKKIYDMSILRIRAPLPLELQGLYFVYLKSYLTKAGITGTPGPHWLRTKMYNKIYFDEIVVQSNFDPSRDGGQITLTLAWLQCTHNH